MPLTFAQLLAPPSLEAVRQSFLTNLASLGYVSSWAATGVGRALAELTARGLGDLNSTASLVAMAGLLDFAAALPVPEWLDALAWGFFNELRRPATVARIRVRLTNAASGTTQTINDGQLILTRAGASIRYRNVATGSPTTLGPGDHVLLSFDAENVGTSGNVSGLSEAVQLVTAIPGVTATLEDTGDGTPMVTSAVDAETNTQLAARCRLKWATLAYSDPADKLKKWALDVSGVTKAEVNDANPRGPYTVDVYLANDTGTVGSDTRLGVQNTLSARRLLPSNVLAIAATEDATTLTATIYARGTSEAAVRFALENSDPALGPLGLLRQRQAAMEIGKADGSVKLYRAQLIEDLMTPAGVYNVTLSAPASDVTPALGHLPVILGHWTLTVVT